MPIYTVHEPPLRRYETEPDPVHFIFVRDGFSFWAFVLGAIWMLRYRLWLVLLGYIVLVVAIATGLHVVGAPFSARLLVAFLIALLVGLEATTLRRWTLSRRGWVNLGVVAGPNRETAERRFFDAWVASGGSGYMLPIPPPPPSASRNDGAPPDVIGLFPEPGARA